MKCCSRPLNRLPVSIVEFDVDGRLLAVNSRFRRLLGLGRTPVSGRTLQSLCIPADKEALDELLSDCARAVRARADRGFERQADVRLARGDGSSVRLRLRVTLAGRRPPRVLGVCLDNAGGDERPTDAAATIASERRWLERVLDLIPAPLMFVESREGRVLFANAALDAMLGAPFPRDLPAAEYRKAYVLCDENDRPLEPHEHPGIRVSRGETVKGVQLNWHTPAGRHTVLMDAAYVPPMPGDGLLGKEGVVILAAKDITALRTTHDDLSQAVRLRDQFLVTLSHELRTPMSVVLGWLQILRTEHFDESELRSILETVERNARAQMHLIDDLLDVARVVGGKIRLDVRAVDLSEITLAGIEPLRLAATQKNISLETKLEPGLAGLVGDPDRLMQVVWNLVSNAVKFTPQGGHVGISLKRTESAAVLTVEDTGIGIESEFLPHVFERFRQEDSSASRTAGGLGLGLAIVRHIVEMHGGTVSAESAGKGKGARFTVTLPLRAFSLLAMAETPDGRPAVPHEATAVGHRADAGADKPMRRLAGAQVLVVDDSADVRRLLSFILESQGASVTTASSAAEGYERLRERPFDVLVSDIGMPEEDGVAFLARIRSGEAAGDVFRKEVPSGNGHGLGHGYGRDSRTMPAIALTAYAREEERRQVLDAGFQLHLSKPVSREALIDAVARLVPVGAGAPS